MKEYFSVNIILFIVYSIGFLYLILPIKQLGFILLLVISLFPCFIVHLIEPKQDIDKIETEKSPLNLKKIPLHLKNTLKSYIFKYLNSYLTITIILTISLLLIYCSSIISIVLLINQIQTSLGLILILFFSAFILFEGFDILISLIPILITVTNKKLNLFKGVIECKKVFKKQRLMYIFEVVIFAILFLPIIMISDCFKNITYISMLLRFLYGLVVLNFFIFNWKEKSNVIDNK